MCHLGNIATRLGRSLEFDPQKEQFVGDARGQRRSWRREYREHWAHCRAECLTLLEGIKSMSPCFVPLLHSRLSCRAPTRPRPPTRGCKSAADYSEAHGGQTMVVLFDGKLVCERYANGGAADQLQGLVSGVKSFVGVAAAAAVQDGFLRLDDPASEGIPEWKEDPAKAKVTYRQLLTMTSGLMHSGAGREAKSPSWKEMASKPMAAKAGERFQYGAYQHNTFAYALERKLGNEKFEDYLKRRILDPLGIQLDWRMWCEDGHPWVGGGGYMRARDWATFGELVRKGGTWEGKQLVDKKLLAECFRGTPANPAYGLTWWLKQPVPDELVREIPILSEEWGEVANSDWLPSDLACAFGGGKQRLFVIPSLKLVIVRQGKGTKEFSDIEFLSLLLRGHVEG